MKEEENVHEGHRKRLRDRYAKTGLAGFEEHTLLELILCYALPRKDTNPLAHRLIRRFGSLSGVLNASTEELMQVSGVGEHTATLLHLFLDVEKFCRQEERQKQNPVLATSAQVGTYLVDLFKGEKTETLFMLCLDEKHRLCACEEVSKGNKDSTSARLKELAQICVRRNSSDVILAHNHPSGCCVPSQQDFMMTRKTHEFLQGMGICLHDHIIVADGEYYSMKEHHVF